MKQLIQNMRDGKTEVVDAPVPSPKPGYVLVKTAASLVSVGTERSVVEFAQKSLIGKAQSRPDLVGQVLDKAKREGIVPTLEAAFNRLDQPMPLGYSMSGTIVEIGEGVGDFQIGQRVVCAGGNARHAEYVSVEKNLVASLSDSVDFDSGAFSTLGAIAMHGFRLAFPQVGETVVVVGLGLLGLVTVAVAKAAGCRVIGIDLDPRRVKLAKELGAESASREEAEESVMAFTQNKGADIILVCAATSSNDPVELAGTIARDRGRVVALGVVGMDLPHALFFKKELDFKVSRSYGPGRYDPVYEDGGIDYPISYVRWTAGRNLEGFANLLGEGLDITPLITHRFPIEDAVQAYQMITQETEEIYLGVLLTYPEQGSDDLKNLKTVQVSERKAEKTINLGVFGAGLYASAVMLPSLKADNAINLVGIATASGATAQQAASRFGFAYASTDNEKILEDKEINTIGILTRHHLHAQQTLGGLRAGKHVFVEKPLTIKEEDLDEIKKEINKPGAPILMVGFNRRFAPLAIKMKAFLDLRKEPVVASYRVNAGYLPLTHWHHDIEQGGGRILSEGCHFIDYLTWLIGEVPSSVTAEGMSDQGKYYEDNIVITLSYPDGSVGTVSYMANGDKSFSKERVEAFSGGRIAVLDNYRSLELIKDGRRKVHKSRLKMDKGHKAEWQVLAEAIKAGGPPPIPYDEIIGVHRATFAAVRALRTGKKQSI